MIDILSKLKNFKFAPENLIYVAFACVFLPYLFTGIIAVGIGLYLLLNPNTQKQIFVHKGKTLFLLFTAYTAVVAMCYKNYYGLACSAGFFIIIVISYYARSVMTEQIFERSLDICAYSAIPVSVAAIIEKLLNSADADYRCKLWFFNENYFCTLMVAVILICAFCATSHKKKVLKYYICAVFAAVALYLGESIFAFVSLFVGMFVLLILMRKHTLLAVFLLTVCICLVILYCVPDIFPRLWESNITTGRRIRIWNAAMEFIGKEPFFGRGFLSYYQHALENPSTYQTAHAHNFALEPLISFGLVGTALLLIFLWSYYKKVAECKERLRNNYATTFVLTMSAAILVHMTTDMTIFWIQTGLLYGLILGCVGVDEKALNKRILACAVSQHSSKTEENING